MPEARMYNNPEKSEMGVQDLALEIKLGYCY
jgi:hypothetical protein